MQEMELSTNFSRIYGKPLIHSSYNLSLNEGGGFLMAMPVPRAKEFFVLKDIVSGVLRLWKFYEEYSVLLQEYISPEDYEEAQKEIHERTGAYAKAVRVMSEGEIAMQAKILLSLSGAELGSDEIAEILNVDMLSVESALRKYSRKAAD